MTMFFAIISTILVSCRKGDDDPAISLRSRKGRITNEWKITKSEKNGEVQQSNGDTYIKFKKDGTGETTETDNNVTQITNFRWDLLKGNGKFKNKERLVIIGNTESSSVVYEILELRHNIMVLYYDTEFNSKKDEYKITVEPK